MSDDDAQIQALIKSAYEVSAQQLMNGTPPDQIRSMLIEKGFDEESASTIVSNLVQAKTKANRGEGGKNMLFGFLWCAGGLAITAISYSVASSSPGGGRYVLAWGAVVFGAIQFFRGVMQSMSE